MTSTTNNKMHTIEICKLYSVELCRSKPTHLFVFGDNLQQYGKRGQAVIRGRTNAIGVPTKKRPALTDDAFFTDDEYEENAREIDDACRTIERKLSANPQFTHLVFPADGLGTGLANLAQRAPKTAKYLDDSLVALANRVEFGSGAKLTRCLK